MARVSVVSGYYNRAEVLKRTVDSILGQSFRDLELIVFDDCSTDDTAVRMAELAEEYRDDRFKYIVHSSNKGFVKGLREAIDKSSGDYIAIQGSGDVSLPRRIALQTAFLDANPEAAAVGGWYYNVQERQGTARLRKPNANGLTIEDWRRGNLFSHGEVMIRRDAYEAVGGYRQEFKFSQDYDLWLRLAQRFELGSVLEPLYERYVQFDGVSYVPKKVVTQTCFGKAAVRLSEEKAERQTGLLSTIAEHGPESVVPPESRPVQAELFKASIRLSVFGSTEAGSELAAANLRSALQRAVAVGFAKVFGSRAFRAFRPLVWRRLGIRKYTPRV